MKQWTREIEVNAPIEHVWKFLDGSLENMQKIMPQVVDNQPVKITDEVVGSIYRQKYKEGKRIMEYDVETLEYLDSPSLKKMKVGFTLAKMFEITAFYQLKQMNETKTLVQYTVTNRALKWFVHLFLFFANDKVVRSFLERYKMLAEIEV